MSEQITHPSEEIQTYPNALFDQIIFIPLELVLQPIRLGFHDLIRTINPFSVENGFTFVRRGLCKRGNRTFIPQDILA